LDLFVFERIYKIRGGIIQIYFNGGCIKLHEYKESNLATNPGGMC
jgi:hypothetical protein